MQILHGLKTLNKQRLIVTPVAVTFGKFDGLHLGHQRLLRVLKKAAAAEALATLVISFLYTQAEGPSVSYPYVCSQRERERALCAWGIDYLLYLDFAEVRTLGYHEFLKSLLTRLNLRVLVGSDKMTIGLQKRGKPAEITTFLQTFAKTHQLKPIRTEFISSLPASETIKTLASQLNKHSDGQLLVSSAEHAALERTSEFSGLLSTTFIKSLLAKGHVGLTRALTWTPYALSGIIHHGKGLGRNLGFPTANFYKAALKTPLKPATYITWALIKQVLYPAVTFLGTPLAGEPDATEHTLNAEIVPIIETFIIDFTASLYNIEVSIYFLKLLRVNFKPQSLKALQIAITEDVARARVYFHAATTELASQRAQFAPLAVVRERII